MNYDSFPMPDHSLFFKTAAQRHEFLGIATLNKRECNFNEPFAQLCFNFRNFVIKTATIFKDSSNSDVVRIDDRGRSFIKNEDWFYTAGMLGKLTWLAKEYVRHGEFKNRMCAHWNPTINKFDIHPGSSRKLIHYLFGPEEEEFIVFNTHGKHINWKDKFTSLDDFVYKFPGYNTADTTLAFVQHHNSIIPYVHIDSTTAVKNAFIQFEYLRNFFATTNIDLLFDHEITKYIHQYYRSLPKGKTVHAEINVHDEIHKYRALLLMMIFDKFEGYGVRIWTTYES